MRMFIFLLSLLAIFLAFEAVAPETGFQYPVAKKSDVVDDYNGVKVADPYRWLENPDSPETRAWIEAEDKLTFGFLEKIPEREKIKNRLTELWNYGKYEVPWKEGNRYFYRKNNGLQNQSVLYTVDSLKDEPRVLLDPNQLSSDGTVAIADAVASPDGKLLAYGLAASGSDWNEWKIRDVKTANDLTDDLKWLKFSSVSWTRDAKGFYYGRYAEPKQGVELEQVNYFQKMYFHKVGTPQSQDSLIYERPDQKEWAFIPTVTEDGSYLVITIWKGTSSIFEIYYKDLRKPDSKVTPMIDKFEADYTFIGNEGPLFFFRTNLKAPRGKVIAIDVEHPERDHWKQIIPEATDRLVSVSLVNNQLVASYLKDAYSQAKIFDLNGKLVRGLTFPGIGSVEGFTGRKKDAETFYSFKSYSTPAVIYHYNLANGTAEVFRKPSLKFNPEDYETNQIFYHSKDGTRVPMFISHKKTVKPGPDTPTYLYGYGGFDISESPDFNIGALVWMEMGGNYAVANIRGGGEYGEEWHQGGTHTKKQNVFNDFIAAAEWLIANHYTSTPKLAIGGASNGGLLIGACITQRPDLYGAALPAVGVMDMLRFNKFTIGWAWVDDYGSPENPADFKAIYAYSPLQNVKPGTHYPPTLITTADHDDRVVPAHSFKFAATMQAAQSGPAPVLIRIDVKAGHGSGKPTTKIIEEVADKWAFLVRELHMKL